MRGSVVGPIAGEWPAGVRALVAAVLFLVAAAVTAWLIRPLSGPVAYDAAASVLYFERIASGQHLEAFVNTTPKPFLSVVLGVIWIAGHDWRLISAATIVATAASVVLGAELARRLAGLAAAAFAFVALAGLYTLQVQASWSYGLPYALALWLAAALAVVRPRPRYGLAGILLLLAALARPETFILLGLATLVVVALIVRPRLAGPSGSPSARDLAPVLLGWLALAVMGIHDGLLTGNPMYWTTVAAAYAADAGAGRTPGEMLGVTAARLVAYWPATILAVLGTAVLVSRRAWAILLGLLALGPGAVAETLFFAWRGLNVRTYYLDPLDVVVLLAAAVAVGVGAGILLRAVASRGRAAVSPTAATVVLVAAAGLLAVVATEFAPLHRADRSDIRLQARLARHETIALTPLRVAIARTGPPRLFVPRPQLARLAVDLAVPVWAFDRLDRARLGDAGYPPAGSLVFFDVSSDLRPTYNAARAYRVSEPTRVGDLRVVPLLAQTRAGVWVVRLDPLR